MNKIELHESPQLKISSLIAFLQEIQKMEGDINVLKEYVYSPALRGVINWGQVCGLYKKIAEEPAYLVIYG